MIGEVEPDRTSPSEDGFDKMAIEARTAATTAPGGEPEETIDWLKLLKDAEQRGAKYMTENLRAGWESSYRAFRNQHFQGSKYYHTDYRNRSKLFRPKTRTAVRRSDASAVSALFSSTDAVKLSAGDETDPQQRANAALLQEVLNYRTDRTSGRAALPWFRLCAGAHQDAMIQSACVSKQSWKIELRKVGDQPRLDDEGNEVLDESTGEKIIDEVHEPHIDRPDCQTFPLEHVLIDPAASWLSPIQSAAFFIAKYPMSIDEVMQMQHHPLNPWKPVSADELRSSAAVDDAASKGTRQARDGGTDRLDSRYTGARSFQIVWVYEVFIRWKGVDYTFWSAESRKLLTEPKPVEEVYPEQGGERPYTFGVINLESHRLFPMSPVESWQQSQIEINDFANLTLDVAKLAVAPVAKVVRGKNIDTTQLTKRGPNSQILVDEKDDVTWDKEPGPDQSAFSIMERLNNDFDTSAGLFDQSTVQSSRYTGETVGGLKLISGAANATSEFDLRVWIETWVEPTLAQIVKLIQYYESDETILALCGRRAQLVERFGINAITDELLQKQVKVRIDAGVGNADPQQKLAKLQSAIGVLTPAFQVEAPAVMKGEVKLDLVALSDEVFSLAGYRDQQFVVAGQPAQPAEPPPSEIAKAKDLLAAAGLKQAQAGKVAAETAKTKVETIAAAVGVHHDHTDQQHQHGMERAHLARDLVTDAHGHAAGAAERAHRDREFTASREDATAERQMRASEGEGGAGTASPPPQPQPEPSPEPQQQGGSVAEQLVAALMAVLRQPRARQLQVHRGADGRIAGLTEISGGGGGEQEPPPQLPPPSQPQSGPPSGGLVV